MNLLTLLAHHAVINLRAQALYHACGFVQVCHRHQNAKFLPAKAAYHIAGAQSTHAAQAKVLQHQVAGMMSVLIIDFLKKVDIHHRKRKRRAIALKAADLGL